MACRLSKNGVEGVQKVIFMLLICVIGTSIACNGGFKIKVRKVENCGGPDAIITANENYTAVLTKNCEIKSRGCVSFKSFNTAISNLKVKKDGIVVLQDKVNLCERLAKGRRDANIGQMLKTLRLPESCPVEEGTLCTDPSQVVNIEQYKQFLPLARGLIDIEMDIQHDTGKSCFRVQIDIAK
uniref:Putative 16.8 kDa salivary secreted protein n=1 Tax=Culex tarsalis TaxID=7177 RepID=A0A1Q3FR32_CULTA